MSFGQVFMNFAEFHALFKAKTEYVWLKFEQRKTGNSFEKQSMRKPKNFHVNDQLNLKTILFFNRSQVKMKTTVTSYVYFQVE